MRQSNTLNLNWHPTPPMFSVYTGKVYTDKVWLLNILGNDMYTFAYLKLLSFSGSQRVSKCLVWEIYQQNFVTVIYREFLK